MRDNIQFRCRLEQLGAECRLNGFRLFRVPWVESSGFVGDCTLMLGSWNTIELWFQIGRAGQEGKGALELSIWREGPQGAADELYRTTAELVWSRDALLDGERSSLASGQSFRYIAQTYVRDRDFAVAGLSRRIWEGVPDQASPSGSDQPGFVVQNESIWRRLMTGSEDLLRQDWKRVTDHTKALNEGLSTDAAWRETGLDLFLGFAGELLPFPRPFTVRSDPFRRVFWLEDSRGRSAFRKVDRDLGIEASLHVYWTWLESGWVIVK